MSSNKKAAKPAATAPAKGAKAAKPAAAKPAAAAPAKEAKPAKAAKSAKPAAAKPAAAAPAKEAKAAKPAAAKAAKSAKPAAAKAAKPAAAKAAAPAKGAKAAKPVKPAAAKAAKPAAAKSAKAAKVAKAAKAAAPAKGAKPAAAKSAKAAKAVKVAKAAKAAAKAAAPAEKKKAVASRQLVAKKARSTAAISPATAKASGIHLRIQKKGRNAVVSPTERAVVRALNEIETNSADLRAELRSLHILAAREISLGKSGKKAVVLFVPYKLLAQFRKIQPRLVRELEKKFSGKHVLIIAKRTILPKETRNNHVKRQKRPRSRTLTAVHDALLEDIVYPTEIVGKRTRYRLDSSRVFKIYLDKKDQANVESKLDTFSSVYKRLTGKTANFSFPPQPETPSFSFK